MSNDAVDLSAEDAKLVTLARATRARAARRRGRRRARPRRPDLRRRQRRASRTSTLSALEVCVAMASSSGSAGLEAAVVLTDGEPADSPPCATSPAPACRCTVGDARGAIARSLAT